MITIKEVHIDSFGALSNVSYEFTEGVNILSGANASGKSTLAHFIKFIFYGLSSKTVGGISEKTRWSNWDTGISSGAIVISDGEKGYRIERKNVQGTRTGTREVKIIDLETLSECYKGEEPGEVFFGMNAETFEESAFASQNCAGIDQKVAKAAIENMLSSGSESLNTKSALKKLDDARITLLYKNKGGGKIYENEKRIEALSDELRSVSEYSNGLDDSKKHIESLKSEISKAHEKAELLRKKIKRAGALKAFEGIENYKKALSAYEEKNEKLTLLKKRFSDIGVNTDISYTSKFSETSITYGMRRSNFESAKEELAKCEKQKQESGSLEEFSGLIGGGSIKKEADKIKQRKKNTLNTLILFSVITLIWLAVSIFALVSKSSIGNVYAYSISVAELIFLTVDAFIYFRYRKLSGLLDCLLEKYGISDYSMIEEKENEIIERMKRRQNADTLYEKCLHEYEKSKNLLEDVENSARELMKTFGKEYTDFDDFKKESEKILSELSDISALEAECFNAKKVLDFMKQSLSGDMDEEEIAEAMKETEGVGDVSDLLEGNLLKETYSKLSMVEEFVRRSEEELSNARVADASSSASMKDPTEIKNEMDLLKEQNEKYKKTYNALVLAYDSLKNASEKVRSSISPRLTERAGEFIGRTVDSDFSLGVSGDLELSFRENSSIQHPDGYMSGGTRDLSYVSVRIALSELLSNGNMPPMIFDEAFSQIDEKRLEKILSLLDSEKGFQTIILTSSEREKRILDKVRER